MFSFFKKKPSEAESIAFCLVLASTADLDVVFRGGVPTFLIFVRESGERIKPHLEHKEQFLAMFTSVIDKRIVEEFPEDPNTYLGLPAEILGDRSHEFREARRVVASVEKKGLFQWRWDENSNLRIGNLTDQI